MNRRRELGAQRRVHRAVPGDPALAGKFRRPQAHVEMALAAAVVARMSRMTTAVVAHFKLAGRERLAQPCFDFRRP